MRNCTKCGKKNTTVTDSTKKSNSDKDSYKVTTLFGKGKKTSSKKTTL